MTISIHLTHGYIALIDDCDADLAELKWSPTLNRQPVYGVRNSKHGSLYMHRVILQRMLGYELTRNQLTDHINGNGLDNRRSNLRLATHKQNLGNCKKYKVKKTLYKGVRLSRNIKNPYVTAIHLNGKCRHLGYFPTQEEAHLAYCLAAYAQWGEFSNFGENSPFTGFTLEQLEAKKG